MKQKCLQNNEHINKMKDHIYRIFPHAKHIDVRVDQTPEKKFKTFVRVSVPQRTDLIALKTDQDLRKSLEKSQNAIMRQIRKIKAKQNPTHQRLPTSQLALEVTN